MKTGKTLTQLAFEIERQRQSRVDYIAPTKQSLLIPTKDDVQMALKGEDLDMKDLAHQQIATHTDIPAKYYNRMRTEAPELLARNVNHWFTEKPTNRLVRTLDGKVRAFLSDRYRPLENFDLAEAALPTLLDMDLEVISCEITDKRLYIKAVDKRINRDIPSGRRMGDGSHTFFDTCSPAVIISNSEVGCGSLSIESAVWTRGCTNLAIFSQKSLRKYHLGARHELGDGVAELLTDHTRKLTDAAVWSQVRDVVRGAFDQARFDASLDDLRGMADQKITGDVTKVVDLAAKALDLAELEKPSILRHLIEGGDLSKYGLFNAVTRSAEDIEDYDRATDIERAGGKLIELPNSDWKRIAETV